MATIENTQGKRVIRIPGKEMFGHRHIQNVSMVLAAFTIDGKTIKEEQDFGGPIYKWEFPANMPDDVLRNALTRLEVSI